MKKQPYTAIPNHLFNKISKLTGKSLYVYILLRSKLIIRKGSLIPINNVVTCSYSEAEKHGIFKMAFSRGIKQLIEIRLITIEQKGSYGGRNPTKYKIL